MNDKITPETQGQAYSLIQYGVFIGFSVLGGVVSFAQRVRSGHSRWSNLIEMVGELVSAAFAGFLVLLLCEYFKYDVKLTGAMVGIAGWMGTRCLYLLEQFLANKFGLRHGPLGEKVSTEVAPETDRPLRKRSEPASVRAARAKKASDLEGVKDGEQ